MTILLGVPTRRGANHCAEMLQGGFRLRAGGMTDDSKPVTAVSDQPKQCGFPSDQRANRRGQIERVLTR